MCLPLFILFLALQEIGDPLVKLEFIRLTKLLARGDIWAFQNQLKPSDLDRKWEKSLEQRHLIGHALGNYKIANTLEAAEESLGKGIRFLEVDLTLDNRGLLRCHHGPEPVSAFTSGDCELNNLLDLIEKKSEAYLILDIKSDFDTSFNKVLMNIAQRNDPSRSAKLIIFQLYKPSHLKHFSHASYVYSFKLNSPILTLYKTHTSLASIIKTKPSFVNVVTIPWWRKAEISQLDRQSGLILTHPLDDCSSLKESQAMGFAGAYGPNSLIRCQNHSYQESAPPP